MSEVITQGKPKPKKDEKPKESKPKWTYMLRIIGRQPKNFPLDRLGAYLTEFADLLGKENTPTFCGIHNASVGVAATIPVSRTAHVHARLTQARTEPSSRPGKILDQLEKMIGMDGVRQAELLDSSKNVIYHFEGRAAANEKQPTISQTATVDGVVIGMVGADDTMHLHLRDNFDRDIRILVRDEEKARKILEHFRKGMIRVTVNGSWKRTEYGWIPETSKCTLIDYEVLEEKPISEILAKFAAVPGNGWAEQKDPDGLLSELRGEEE